MKKKDEIRQELEDLGATRLAKWHQRSASHTLPDEYWDDCIEQAIIAEGATPGDRPARRVSLYYLATIAAGFLMLLAGTWMYFQEKNQESKAIVMSHELTVISDEEIVNYINANLDDFDLALLSTYLQEIEPNLLFETDASIDSIEDSWAEDAEWLMREEGVDLF